MTEYMVKGSTIISKFTFVAERFGAPAAAALHTLVPLPALLDSSWYPYRQYVSVLQAIAATHYAGELQKLIEVGTFSAEKALTTRYKIFVKDEFSQFLTRISGLHKLLYNKGSMQPTLSEDGRTCQIRHIDKPEFSEADAYVALGFYLGAARLHGLHNCSGHFSLYERGALFEIRWS